MTSLLHPRARLQEPYLKPSDCLPGAITYAGPRSHEHRLAYAQVLLRVAAGDIETFRAMLSTVHHNGYGFRFEDLTAPSPEPDTVEAEALRANLADIAGVAPGALRVTPARASAFRSWVQENISPNVANGLQGAEWWTT